MIRTKVIACEKYGRIPCTYIMHITHELYHLIYYIYQ